MEKTTWFVDLSTSIHICSTTPELMYTIYKLDKPVEVHLLDGSSRRVACVGKVRLNKDIILMNVFYIPGFTQNLLSVCKILGLHVCSIKLTVFSKGRI